MEAGGVLTFNAVLTNFQNINDISYEYLRLKRYNFYEVTPHIFSAIDFHKIQRLKINQSFINVEVNYSNLLHFFTLSHLQHLSLSSLIFSGYTPLPLSLPLVFFFFSPTSSNQNIFFFWLQIQVSLHRKIHTQTVFTAAQFLYFFLLLNAKFSLS